MLEPAGINAERKEGPAGLEGTHTCSIPNTQSNKLRFGGNVAGETANLSSLDDSSLNRMLGREQIVAVTVPTTSASFEYHHWMSPFVTLNRMLPM